MERDLPLWIREAADLAADALPLPDTTDVVVLGGGVAGISAALALARGGADVTVLEAGRVASRASGRNDGQLLLGLGEHYNRIVGQFGRDDARKLWDFIERNQAALRAEFADDPARCGLMVAGGLRLAETPHEACELDDAAALLAEDGIAHERIDADGVAELLPEAVGFHGALRLPGEAVIQPARMVRALAVRAREAGARIHEDCPVLDVEGAAGSVRVRLADGRALGATAVVHCTSTLARHLDPTGFLDAQVFPFRGQIIATEPLPDELAARFPPAAMSSNFCYEYFRMHDARFVLGGMRWSVPGEQLGIVDDSTFDARISAHLEDYAHRHFPCLVGVPFPHVWTGIMAGTSDGLPLCGALPGQSGVFALLGFNGYGLSFACEAGRTIASLILDGRAEHPAATMLAPRRFA
ncbi:MAG: NAD(P)/FAD-dependent oxidoreductase [Planctomycetota bacterium]